MHTQLRIVFCAQVLQAKRPEGVRDRHFDGRRERSASPGANVRPQLLSNCPGLDGGGSLLRGAGAAAMARPLILRGA